MASKKSNHARKLNGGILSTLNERWAARVLGMGRNPSFGIDLIDDFRNLGVEVKFTINQDPSAAWTTQNHQLNYDADGRVCFWGLGLYELDRPVRKIKSKSQEKVEAMVLRRDLYLVVWDWMRQFEPSDTSGETEMTSWELTLRYPRRRLLPEVYRSYSVEKGSVNLTVGVPRGLFEREMVSLTA